MELITPGLVYFTLSKRYRENYVSVKAAVEAMTVEKARHYPPIHRPTIGAPEGRIVVQLTPGGTKVATSLIEHLNADFTDSMNNKLSVEAVLKSALSRATFIADFYELREFSAERWGLLLARHGYRSDQFDPLKVMKFVRDESLWCSLVYDSPTMGHPMIYSGVPVKIRPHYVKLFSLEPHAGLRTFSIDKIINVFALDAKSDSAVVNQIEISWGPRPRFLSRQTEVTIKLNGLEEPWIDPRKALGPRPYYAEPL